MKKKLPEVRPCVMCAEPTGVTGRKFSREHVLGDKILKELNLSAGIPRWSVHRADTGKKEPSKTNPRSDKVIAYGICEPCNNGWMNVIQNRARPLVVELASHRLTPVDLSSDQRWVIAQWALMTACSAGYLPYSDNVMRIPELIQYARSGTWPKGAIAFITYHPGADDSAFANRTTSSQSLGGLDGSNITEPVSTTVIATYRDVGIGFAYIRPEIGRMVVREGIHQPLYAGDTEVMSLRDILPITGLSEHRIQEGLLGFVEEPVIGIGVVPNDLYPIVTPAPRILFPRGKDRDIALTSIVTQMCLRIYGECFGNYRGSMDDLAREALERLSRLVEMDAEIALLGFSSNRTVLQV